MDGKKKKTQPQCCPVIISGVRFPWQPIYIDIFLCLLVIHCLECYQLKTSNKDLKPACWAEGTDLQCCSVLFYSPSILLLGITL